MLSENPFSESSQSKKEESIKQKKVKLKDSTIFDEEDIDDFADVELFDIGSEGITGMNPSLQN